MRSVFVLALLFAASACTRLPDVDPGALACFDDAPLPSGELPCPEADRCVDGACAPRLGCDGAGPGGRGCQDDPVQPAPSRCEPLIVDDLAAVRCEPGTHTATSARPLDGGCDCPDGLHCVAFGAGPPGTYPLFLPVGGASLPARLGPEVADRRMCVRACSSEANCPADHTCRPAAVVSPGAPPSARRTVAVCYPNLLVATSTLAALDPPDPGACLQPSDCGAVGIARPVCQYEVRDVADHPLTPLGAAWAGRQALVPRCLQGGDGGLLTPGLGCEAGRAGLCESGLCIDGRCAALCDPAAPEEACLRRRCVERVATRVVPGGGTVEDRVHVCER